MAKGKGGGSKVAKTPVAPGAQQRKAPPPRIGFEAPTQEVGGYWWPRRMADERKSPAEQPELGTYKLGRARVNRRDAEVVVGGRRSVEGATIRVEIQATGIGVEVEREGVS